ncbi:olfactory receptor 2Z1 [Suncus etruscus]|uniref:olfactory receptor 2Z1 n=1 Tax=Suncus etruscus TaxID=109475 RepID=UPI00210FE76D|nr:olfactory receptor 2Z1 [Suncus etruscus]
MAEEPETPSPPICPLPRLPQPRQGDDVCASRMGPWNQSADPGFTLTGLFGHSAAPPPLLALVATVFSAGLLGNAVLLLLIRVDARLHTAMYFLLSQLSLLDIGFPLVTIPKMLAVVARGDHSISRAGCMAQMFCLMLMGVSEGVLLSLMSYDRYVAVCHPLHYALRMTPRLSLLMAAASWASGLLVASVLTAVALHIPFGAERAVQHFFCELPALLRLACTDVAPFELALSVSGVAILLLPLSLVFSSYGHVLAAVVRMRSAEARHKAFATCSSHLAVVGLFYGAAVFIYMVPGTYHTPQQDDVVSLFYSLVTPTLNPLIYSLRNREVRAALAKVLGRAALRAKR